jgi:hypothetical protein
MREVGIGIAGFGTVGGGVLSILQKHARDIESRLGARIVVRRVAIRDPEKERMVEVPRALLTTRFQDLIDDPQIAVVVELLGGTEEAFDLVVGALDRGKHVVTANKALLAARGEEIFRRAVDKGVDVYYEGAVCGGVPVIRTLREALASDRISALHGIINGTTNFILTAMGDREQPLSEALAEAQRLGYAEADPTLDVSGGDAAQKLCVLAALAQAPRRPHRGDRGAHARRLRLGEGGRIRPEAPGGGAPLPARKRRRPGSDRGPGASDVHPHRLDAGRRARGHERGAAPLRGARPLHALRPGGGGHAHRVRGRLGHHRPHP